MHLLLVIIEFSIVLGIMVLIHELGHFLVGKACGVRIETFSIGFGPRIFGIQHGETDYRISLLPVGGYVKFAGEYGTDTTASGPAELLESGKIVAAPTATYIPDPRDLTSQPRWQRVLIAVAGPISNFLLAFFLLFLVAHYHHEVDQYLTGPAVVDYVPQNTPAARDGLSAGDTITRFNRVNHPNWEQILDEAALNLNRPLPFTFLHDGQTHTGAITIASDNDSEFSEDDIMAVGLIPKMDPGPITVLSVQGGSPADRAGLQAGDQLFRINNLYPHSIYTLLDYLKDSNGAPVSLGVLRNGRALTLNATPEKIEAGGTLQYRLGFTYHPPPADIQHLPVGRALEQSWKENRNSSKLVFRIIGGLFTRHVSIKQMSGPVGIAQQIDIATQMGIWPLVEIMAAISLQLGILNLLPFPLLDGGMILFLTVESIMRRDVNQQLKEVVYQVAFFCIILFMFFVLFNDVTKLHLGH